MTGRVMIVTGGNSGIGYEVAKYLCEGGNDVVLACRDKDAGAEAVHKIKLQFPHSLVQCMQLDLSSESSIRQFVQDFTRKKRKLNVLVNNAAMAPNFKDTRPRITTEGNELTMATNFLGPFLLTNLLREYMIQTTNIMGDGRIVNVSCALHDHENNWTSRGMNNLDVKNFQLQKEGTYNGLQAYKNSKLCNILMTYYMAEQLKGTDVMCNAVDPGSVPTTRLMRNANKVKRTFNVCCLHNVMRPCTHMTLTVKEAARMVADVAVSNRFGGKTGKYFKDDIDDRSSIESYDRELQREVWRAAAKIVNINQFADADFDDISLHSTGPSVN